MFPYRLSRNRHENRRQKPVWCSMVKRFADLRWLTALILLALPTPSPAQSLPGHFQYSETRGYVDGRTCVVKSQVSIRGSNVFLSALSKVCEDASQGFTGDEDEGFVFPLGGTASGPKNCTIAVGIDPIMKCSDGETKSVLGFEAKERLRVEGFQTLSSSWNGSQLVLDLESSETRYTMAGGSGRKPQKIHIQLHFEFSFSGNTCRADHLLRVRTINGRHDSMIKATPTSCQVLR